MVARVADVVRLQYNVTHLQRVVRIGCGKPFIEDDKFTSEKNGPVAQLVRAPDFVDEQYHLMGRRRGNFAVVTSQIRGTLPGNADGNPEPSPKFREGVET